MELELKKGSFRAARPVFSHSLTAEESADAVVPDSKPDILRIVDTTAEAELSGREIRGGRIYLSGVVRCFALYAPENGGSLESLTAALPFSVACEPEKELFQDAVIRAGVDGVSVFAREQNPRRINVRASVKLFCRGWEPEEPDYCEDIPAAEAFGVELRREEVRTSCISGFGEKILSVTESAELGEVKTGGAELLRWDVKPKITETKLIPEKVVFKGELEVSALLKTPEDPNPAANLSVSVPFSGVTDCSGADTDADAELSCRCFDTELSVAEETGTGRGILTVKTNVSVEAQARRIETPVIVTDAYSTTHELKAAYSKLVISPEPRRVAVRVGASETVSAGIGIKSVLCIRVSAEDAVISAGELGCAFRATVIFEGEDGSVYSASKNFRAAVEADCGGMRAAEMRVCEESYRITGADQAEIRAAAEIVLESGGEETRSVLSAASAFEREISGRSPSLTLCGTLEGESWWDLGKRMRARVEDILSANALSEEDPPGDRMLLIPKKAPCRMCKTRDGGNA